MDRSPVRGERRGTRRGWNDRGDRPKVWLCCVRGGGTGVTTQLVKLVLPRSFAQPRTGRAGVREGARPFG